MAQTEAGRQMLALRAAFVKKYALTVTQRRELGRELPRLEEAWAKTARLHHVLDLAEELRRFAKDMCEDDRGALEAKLGAIIGEAAVQAARPDEVKRVTTAMALGAMREHSAQMGESFDALWASSDEQTKATLLSEWEHILESAFEARRLG